MANQENMDSSNNGENSDEQFQDHLEDAPVEGRIPVEKIKGLEEEAQRRLESGEAVDKAGKERNPRDLRFVRNDDFAGNEASLDTDADFSRGSGFLGGKLIGEGSSSEARIPGPEEKLALSGYDLSEEQLRNIETIRREQAEREASQGNVRDTEETPEETAQRLREIGESWSQGRDIGHREQVTGSQRFGRDLGSSGLGERDFVPGEEEEIEHPKAKRLMTAEQKDWNAVLRKLGGSSPGSAENLQLGEKFRLVQFPATKDDVLRRLEPNAEFQIKPGMTLDLHHAVQVSRKELFRNLNDLIDCVKDELRRGDLVAGQVH